MKNTYFNAKLISLRRISVNIFTSLPRPSNMSFLFLENDKKPVLLKMIKQATAPGLYLFEVELPFDYPFGSHCLIHSYYLGKSINVDISNAVNFPEFDSLFNYSGDDLGAIYTPEQTTFTIWAPLASAVILKLENDDHEFVKYWLKREEKGIYRITIKGNLLNKRYHYIVNNYGIACETNDPYSFGVDEDSIYSAVVDIESIKKKNKIKPKRVIKKMTDASIYEVHIRDFTESKYSDIVNKGKYLGMVEPLRKTTGGNPAGLDYLKALNISHIQLQPVLDFAGPDSPNYSRDYNWGYDPTSFFALEGSFSARPNIPQLRLEEFRELVDKMHANDIRVNVDVVYNHLFDALSTSFEKTVPGYYFRHRPNGLLSQASGCGNDFASERYMARRAIVLSVKHLFETFDIDGLRYDLMGLIDIATIKECVKVAKSFKSDAMIYGEGWNMGNELPYEEKACSDNAFKLKEVAFFNDSFRDIVKGSTFDLGGRGFASGDFSYSFGFEYAFMGSSVNHCFNKRFDDASQSVNYVECHDNHTILDKFLVSNKDEDQEDLLTRVNLANALTILSFGIPFIHMGQEIGKDKCGLGNTYNVPKVNELNYKEVDDRFQMVKYLSELLLLRDNELSFFKEISNGKEIEEMFDFFTLDNLLWIKLKEESASKTKFKDILFIINVNDYPINYELDDYYKALLLKGGIGKRDDLNIKNGRIAARSMDILVR